MLDHSGAVSGVDTANRPTHNMHEQLPAYAAAIAIGDAPEALYPSTAAHLATCSECQAALHDLLELVVPAYAGQLEPAPRYPAAKLAFLEVPMQQPQLAPAWQLDAGRLVVHFSDALLAATRQPSFAGAARSARGQLLYRYTQEPGSLHDLDVSIEVYAEDTLHRHARIRVGVDVPGRGPLDQTGNVVKLSLGDADWQAETDESGCVDFAPIPLDGLPNLRVEITPLSSYEL